MAYKNQKKNKRHNKGGLRVSCVMPKSDTLYIKILKCLRIRKR